VSETYDLFQQGRRHLKDGLAAQATVARRGSQPPSRLAESLLRLAMRVETSWPFRVPVGTSILCSCVRM